MLRKIICIMPLLVACQTMLGQCLESVGIRYGLTVSTLRSKSPEGEAMFNGQQQGHAALLSLRSSRCGKWGVRTDLGYVQKGGWWGWSGPGLGSTQAPLQARHSYLSISPMLEFRREFGRLELRGFGGPRMDLQLAYTSNHPYMDGYRSFWDPVWGVTYGGGIGHSFGRSTIVAEYQGRPDLSVYGNGIEGSGGMRSHSHTWLIGLVHEFDGTCKRPVKGSE